jgi:hypothetical protein
MKKAFLFFCLFLSISFSYSVEFMKTDAIKPGMKGYGLSVFKGWEPERFEVEIIDVMKNSRPKSDIILARVSGNGLEKSGVIAGMSGSPVYIDGKLIGAVAYTWPYSKEPICGITPISSMVAEKENADLDFSAASQESKGDFKKIATPLSIHGFNGEAKDYLKQLLESKTSGESYLVSDGGGEIAQVSSNSLKEGDAVAVNLADGDYSIQGVGTVTYVSNHDIFIFGHPMDLAGNVSLPISRSYIYAVIPSSMLSFKMGSSSQPMGSVVYDGQSALYCQSGRKADMVPVEMTIKNRDGSFNYHFRVADNRRYFPGIASSAVSSAFLNHAGYLDDKRIQMGIQMRFQYQGHSYEIKNRFRFAFSSGFFNVSALLMDLNAYFSILYEGSFGPMEIKDIRVETTIEKGLKYYTLENVSLDKNTYYPGETIQCKMLLKEYHGDYISKVLPVKIPASAKSGQYLVLAGSEASFYDEIGKLFPSYFAVENIEDLLKLANLKQDFYLLTAGLVSPRSGAVVEDKKMEKLPENYVGFFNRSAEKAAPVLFPDWEKEGLELDSAVFGASKAVINIIRKQSQNRE